MMQIKPCPCPFCGSDAVVDTGGFGEKFVTCSNDNCGGRLGTGIWFADETKAIEVWNNRVPIKEEKKWISTKRN